MADELKTILFGKTDKVTLADGKEYVMREPSIAVLKKADLDLNEISKPANLSKLVWVLLTEDQPSLTEEVAGRLVTFSMIKGESPFLKKIYALLGVEEKK